MSLVNDESTDGDSVRKLEANTEEALVNTMGEIQRHCRETRQSTEKTNIVLTYFPRFHIGLFRDFLSLQLIVLATIHSALVVSYHHRFRRLPGVRVPKSTS